MPGTSNHFEKNTVLSNHFEKNHNPFDYDHMKNHNQKNHNHFEKIKVLVEVVKKSVNNALLYHCMYSPVHKSIYSVPGREGMGKGKNGEGWRRSDHKEAS